MRIRSFSALLTSTIALLFVFNSCVKDKCTRRYVYWEPVYRTKDEVRANIKNNSSREIERPGKIYIRGNYIFLNEIDRGIHVIDNTNKSAPKNIAFIDIPGNLDMAVKGNILYADLYTDLVAIDITEPQQILVKKFTENIFPERYYGNGFSQNPTMIGDNVTVLEWRFCAYSWWLATCSREGRARSPPTSRPARDCDEASFAACRRRPPWSRGRRREPPGPGCPATAVLRRRSAALTPPVLFDPVRSAQLIRACMRAGDGGPTEAA